MMELYALKQQCLGCNRCALAQKRNSVVFGVGNPSADIMFVGEGPGEREDALGEPFVGAAGLFLDDMLSIIDLDRKKNIYIANVVKCRPPGNRDPEPEEQDACFAYLKEQIRLVDPKIIVCLGRISAKRLISEEFRITKEHGTWTFRDGIWYTAIYHPSALLRDLSKRPDTFGDLISIRDKMRQLNLLAE